MAEPNQKSLRSYLHRLGSLPLLPWLLFLAAIVLTYPWGNFPLNDDWNYALVARSFAETGIFAVDVPVAPSLFGQTLAAWPIIKIFGFSHVALRCLTILLASSYIGALSIALKAIGVATRERQWTLVVFSLSPFFCYYALTFMTEIYGYVVPVWGIAWWFKAAGKLRPGEALSLPVCIGVGLAIGSAFWTRQYCILPYPALLVAGAITHWIHGERHLWRQLLVRYGAGLIAFSFVIVSYLLWASAAGLIKTNFSGPAATALKWNVDSWRLQPGIILVYMTAFFLPMLILLQSTSVPRSWLYTTTCALVGILVTTRLGLIDLGASWSRVDLNLHNTFPYSGNVLFNGGIGPITLSDVYLKSLPRRLIWPQKVWDALEVVLLLSTILWAAVIHRTFLHLKLRPCRRHVEGLIFGLTLAGISLVVVVQANGPGAFDRYYFPIQIGLVFVVGCCFKQPAEDSPAHELSMIWRRLFAAVSLVALVIFTVGGLHDHFCWQDARWELYRGLLAKGIGSSNIDGGYEIQGWMNFDAWQKGTIRSADNSCINYCHCDRGWYCLDDSYRISMNQQSDDEIIATSLPSYWLTRSPPVYATRRFTKLTRQK